MAVVDIREHVIALEPIKCPECESPFKSITASNKEDRMAKYPNVKVEYECGSHTNFGAVTVSPDVPNYMPDSNITRHCVGEAANPSSYKPGAEKMLKVYLTRYDRQEGDCFAIQNRKLKAALKSKEAEDASTCNESHVVTHNQAWHNGGLCDGTCD